MRYTESKDFISIRTQIVQKPQQINRVFAYIDGFNLYFGLKERKWAKFYWFDPDCLAKQLVEGGRKVIETKYFTAKVKQPDDKRKRQQTFLNAIQHHSDSEIIYGKFAKRTRPCRNCGAIWTTHEEKMTDSAIAAHLVADAFLDRFDTAILIGGDTDIVPAIKLVRRYHPSKRIEAWFPPKRKNQQVADCCDDGGHINGEHLQAALMPLSATDENGFQIVKPSEWS